MDASNMNGKRSPRGDDTPRTKNLKDIRKKRLAYFDSQQSRTNSTSVLNSPNSKEKASNLNAEKVDRKTPRSNKSIENRPLFRPQAEHTPSQSFDKKSEHVTDWTDSRKTAKTLGDYVAKFQGNPHSILHENAHNSPDIRVSQNSQIVANENDTDDVGDDVSDVTQITDTDILLSQQFAEKPLSAFQTAKHKPKSSPRLDSFKPNKSSVHSPRSSPKTSKEGKTKGRTVNSTSTSGDVSFQLLRSSKRPPSVESSISTVASEDLNKLLKTNNQHVLNSMESSLFGLNARTTPLSRDFVAASCESGVTLVPQYKSTDLNHREDEIPPLVSTSQYELINVSNESREKHGISTNTRDSTNGCGTSVENSVQNVGSLLGDILLDPKFTSSESKSPRSGIKPEVNHKLTPSKTADSTDFAPSTHKPPAVPNKSSDLNESLRNSKQRKTTESLNFTNLSMVLGEDKLRRLLQNFEESEDFDDYVPEEKLFNIEEENHPLAMDYVNIWSSIDSSSVGNGLELETPKGLSGIPDVLVIKRANDLPPLVTSQSAQFTDSVYRLPLDKSLNEATPSSVKNRNGESSIDPPSYESHKSQSIAIDDPNELKPSRLSREISFTRHKEIESVSRPVLNGSSAMFKSVEASGELPKGVFHIQGLQQSLQEDDLGLETHRPSSSPTKDPLYASMMQSYDYAALYGSQNKQSADNESVDSKDVSNVTYCFSVDQIYAQANAVNLGNTDNHSDGSSTPRAGNKKPENNSHSTKDTSDIKLNTDTDVKINTESDAADRSKKSHYVTPIEFRKQITTAKSTNFETSKKPPLSGIPPSSKSAEATRMGKSKSLSGPQGDGSVDVGKSEHRNKRGSERGQGDAAKSHSQLEMGKVPQPSSANKHKSLDLSRIEEHPTSKPIPLSVERYFESLEREHLSSVTSSEVTFEPVPEPEIEVTPRDAVDNWVVEGVKSESVTREAHLKKSKQSKVNSESKIMKSTEEKNPSAKQASVTFEKPEKNVTKEPAKVEEVGTSTSEDDLYNTVQSALAEIDTNKPGEIEKKLRSLGIDFEFLRASQNSNGSDLQASNGNINVNKLSTNGVASFQQLPQVSKSQDVSVSDGKLKKYYTPPASKSTATPDLEDGSKFACVCPECAEVNQVGTKQCTECGTSLIDVKPVPVHSSKSPRVSVIQQRRKSNKKIEQAAKTAGTSGLDETLKSQLTLNLKTSTDSTLTNITRTDTSITNAKSQSLNMVYKDNTWMSVDSSISLDYSEGSYNPRKSIPRDLQAQLSIDVEGSSDSSVIQALSKGKGKAWKKKPISNSVQDIRVTDDASQDSASVQNNNENTVKQNGVAVENQGQCDSLDVSSVDEEAQTDRSGPIQEETGYLEFLQRLAQDPRLRPVRKNGTQGYMPQPSTSQGRPKSANSKKPYGGIESKVKSSWDKEAPTRHWEKSNLAWTSYNSRELLKPPGTGLMTKSLQIRPSSAGRSREGTLPARPQSAGKARDVSAQDRPVSARKSKDPGSSVNLRQRPRSAEYGRRSAPLHHECSAPVAPDVLLELEPSAHAHRASVPLLNVQPVKSKDNKLSKSQNSKMTNYKKFLSLAQGYTGKLYDIDETSESSSRSHRWHRTLADAIQMSPRVRSGEVSFMLCLPDEILLMIFSLLKHKELAKCMQVCQHFRRVASDDSLWRSIVLRKSQNVTDAGLTEIGRKQPRSLSLIQCHGSRVTNAGLRELFRQCAESLQELNFTGCSRGHLTGDNILLHAASRCTNITSLDASWCNVNDNGIMALAESSQRLQSLSVNGCQQISDEALITVVNKHGIYLQTLELFGCFNITARAIASLSNHCKSLTTLNLGQCWKLTDTCIANLAPSLQHVEHLDLRGCKQIKDVTVHQVVKHCPRLQTLALANCVNLTDTSLAEIATYCAHIESLDLCGCKLITNVGMRSLTSCQRLLYLDVSSTAVTSKGVSSIASYCSTSLEVLKINFCKQINVQCLTRLARNCKRLQKLYLYGVRGLGPLVEVRTVNPLLLIETDNARSNPVYP